MRRFQKILWLKPVALAAMIMATALSPAYAGTQEIFGTGIGAALGGLLGSQITRGEARLPATAAGVFVGGLVGNSIGSSMDRTDRLYSHHSYPAAIPPTYYEVRRTHYRPNYVAAPEISPATYYSSYTTSYSGYGGVNPYCREYSQRVWIGGEVRESYGTACLQPDGSWRVIP